ncbi:Co2+/Mg2+ efflux protein ApaG [Aeromonas cavernicola]|uniref:Co2+/Mg2+ efflux protein ApaG n=1 Tax=Aeromonas cavernicola TaxID=1006623 RepID=A0A2H9U7N6_9GAMM|nr:Co2+/Mg2+ efflux protein ApaG [Aeromonas cavernicola]PJG60045.1 Co2+/Mg2+ efflux protein ApaG [Aeromonas cavernicola]
MSSRQILIRAYPSYMTGSQNPYLFHYLIEIENLGPGSVQLLRRRWLITDANGKMLEVEGPGVLGEQPVIAPGETFRYQSGVPLATPLGVMEGCYILQHESGQQFEAPIAPFTLAIPNIIN